MEFALSEDQVLLQRSVEGQLQSTGPLEKVREAAAGDASARRAAGEGLAELGVAGLLVGEAQGGLGLGLLEAALVQESLGRHVSPAPFLAGSVMAVSGLRALPPGGDRDAGAGVTAGPDGRLSGIALFALEAEAASHVLVGDAAGGLHMVEADAPGLARTEMRTIDRTRKLHELRFDGVAAQRLDAGNDAPVGAMVQAGRMMLAADTLGAAQRMLEKAVDYAGERKQFDRVIASFQAVKHMCADMAAEIEPARGLVWMAAHGLDEGDADGPLMALLAKSHLAETGTFIARTATEVHGGMGFTDLMGLHFWFKRIGMNRQLLGGPERVRAEAARLQGWA